MTTDYHRYLSSFVGITAQTIDILVENGIDSVNTLRAINMDEDWHRLPTQISIGQKLLLRQALATLSDITDDDYDGNKQEITARRSVANNRTDTVLDNNRKSCKEIESNSCQQLLQQTIDASDQQFVSNDKHCNQSLNTKRLLRCHKKEIHIIDNIEKEINAKQSVSKSRSKLLTNLNDKMDTVSDRNDKPYNYNDLESDNQFDGHINGNLTMLSNNDFHRQALAKLADVIDDDFGNNDKQEITVKQSVANRRSKRIINLKEKMNLHKKSYKDVVADSGKQFCHQKIIATDGRVICHYKDCNQSFKNKYIMRRHLKNVHSTDRPFVCNYDDCNKSFKRRGDINEHQKHVHSSDRPFVCNYDDCNKSFKRKYYMLYHLKYIHSTDRQFICTYDECNQSYKTKEYLRYHQKTVHSTNRIFKQKEKLIRHQKEDQSTDWPFVCQYKGCDKSFKEKQTLIGHQKCVHHSSDRPFVCNYNNCDKSYKFKQQLVEHRKQIHQ
ncbi:zinc finger protein 567-like [Oppia nitens]|uniref:zinc finger protein 567-like n=1 Tax=Oppia nitens TaxID=1686743 RepID=UPI0023DBA837|nr:zinc finger protein 567-like [Oppia nitens]